MNSADNIVIALNSIIDLAKSNGIAVDLAKDTNFNCEIHFFYDKESNKILIIDTLTPCEQCAHRLISDCWRCRKLNEPCDNFIQNIKKGDYNG